MKDIITTNRSFVSLVDCNVPKRAWINNDFFCGYTIESETKLLCKITSTLCSVYEDPRLKEETKGKQTIHLLTKSLNNTIYNCMIIEELNIIANIFSLDYLIIYFQVVWSHWNYFWNSLDSWIRPWRGVVCKVDEWKGTLQRIWSQNRVCTNCLCHSVYGKML